MLNQYAVDNPTLPVNQCFSHIQILVECSAVLWECRAATMGRQAFGTHMVYRETFLQIQPSLLQHLVRRNWIRTHITTCDEWRPSTSSGSEMPVRTVSQKFSHPKWGRIFKELWDRPTTTGDFRSSIWQIHHASNVRLLEDKIQDWGMYLFAISYGSYAMDQRSGDGWISGWSQTFVSY